MIKLIRYKNLLFIVLIQFLMSKAIINPILEMYHLVPLTPNWILLGIIAATVLIAAGGYVINDYFDIKIDRLNRSDKVIVGVEVSKKSAMLFYQILTGLGIVIGIAAAVYIKNFTLGLIFIIVPGMLWFYSSSYKRQLIIGNLIIALSAALVPLVPLVTEASLLSDYYGELIKETPIIPQMYKWVCGFALFAFWWTMIREIIKDIQDQKGDREMECHTIPIVWGNTAAKIILVAMIIIALAVLYWLSCFVIKFPPESQLTQHYFWFGIALPSLCLVIMLILAKTPHDYHNASTLTKFIMLVGVLYSVIFYFIIAQTYGFPLFNLFYIK
jgi:4-hydroxybenzoate polyprenyltransferase